MTAATTDFAGPAAAIMRAISDPGSIVPRLPLRAEDWTEPMLDWQTRAVLAAAAPWLLPAGESVRFQVREARDTLARWDAGGRNLGRPAIEHALADHLRAVLALIPPEATDGN